MALNIKFLLFAAVAVLCVSSATAQGNANHFGGRPGPWFPPSRIKNGCGFKGMTIELPFYAQSPTSIFPTTTAVQGVPQGTNVVRSFFIGNASTPAVRYGSSTANVVIMDADVGGNLRVASGMINVKFEGNIYNGRISFNGNLYFDYTVTPPVVTSELVVVGGTGQFLGAVGSMTTGIIEGGVGGFILNLQIPVKNCFN